MHWNRLRQTWLHSLEQLEDEITERVVEETDECGEDDHREEHDDRVVDRLGTGRPGDLAKLGANLTDELARLGALLAVRGLGRGSLAPLACRRTFLVQLPLSLQLTLHFSVHRHGWNPLVTA